MLPHKFPNHIYRSVQLMGNNICWHIFYFYLSLETGYYSHNIYSKNCNIHIKDSNNSLYKGSATKFTGKYNAFVSPEAQQNASNLSKAGEDERHDPTGLSHNGTRSVVCLSRPATTMPFNSDYLPNNDERLSPFQLISWCLKGQFNS